MTENELRDMIRESIARHMGRPTTHAAPPVPSFRTHASHVVLAQLTSGDEQGMCVIEPSVRCSHCGYCLSYGH